MASRGTQGIMSLLDKMNSPDADFRYMALSDLMTIANDGMLSAGNAGFDERTETTVMQKILDLIKDTNGEVKNMAVKCLGVLVKTIREKQMQLILDKLGEYLSSKDEELRDIASLGLKTVMTEIPLGSSLATTAANKLVPRLLVQISDTQASQEHIIDSLDVLADYFSRFTHIVANDPQLQKQALGVLTKALGNNRAAIRKRAVSALSALAASATSEHFTKLSELTAAATPSSNVETSKTYIQLLGSLTKTCPRRLGRRLPEFMPRILSVVSSEEAQEDDELREACLQTLESIILRCPAEVTPFVMQTVEIANTLLRHDPNYAGGDEDEDDIMQDDADGLGEDDDFLGDEGYSDDEDMSWKVRRESAKLLQVVVTTRSDILTHLTTTIAPALVSRFSEREESVRNEILATFCALLQQIRLYGLHPQATEVMRQSPGALKRKWEADGGAKIGEASPIGQIRKLVPSIAKSLARETSSKSTSTRLSSYLVLQELVRVLQGGLEEHLGLFVNQIATYGKITDTPSSGLANLRAEILVFLRLVITFHHPTAFSKYLDQVVHFIGAAVEDKVHRDAIEGLRVISALVQVLRPEGGSHKPGEYAHVVKPLFEVTTRRLGRPDSDQDIKEGGIATLGNLLCCAGDDVGDLLHSGLTMLLERIRNEMTRYSAVRVAARVVLAPPCRGEATVEFAQQALPEVTGLLRKNNRLLRTATFECLTSFLTCLGSVLSDFSADQVVKEINPLLAHESNFSLVPAAFQSLQGLLSSGKALRTIEETILPSVHSMIQSPLLQGPALTSVLIFIQSLIAADASVTEKITGVMEDARRKSQSGSTATHVHSAVAQCIGAIGVAAPETRSIFVGQAQEALASSNSEGESYFHLRVVGEIGRTQDLGQDQALIETVTAFYESASEHIRVAAAFALGNMAVGNLQSFLPIIEGQLRDEKLCRLALVATKELITHGSTEQLDAVAQQIWTLLFDICATKDEAVRIIGAECLARLTLTQPERYLAQLQSRIHDPVITTRASVISAIRYTLTETSTKYDDMLAPNIIDFLSLLKDESLDVRKPAMFAFNAAAHNRPSLIRDHLDVLLPMLYQETIPKPELLRKVAMGPFTVTTDDGLDLRKNAFETMYTLLDTCFARINLNEYIERVIAGLKDEDGIKVLSSLMLVRLASLAPAQVGQHLDEVVEPITSTLKVKLKDQATKQDVEKSTELQRSLFRAMVALDKTPHSAPKFEALKRDARHGSPLYREVESSFQDAGAGS